MLPNRETAGRALSNCKEAKGVDNRIATCDHCHMGFFSWENPLRDTRRAFHPSCFLELVTKMIEQALAQNKAK